MPLNRLLVAAVIGLSICVVVLAVMLIKTPPSTPGAESLTSVVAKPESTPTAPPPVTYPELATLEPAVAKQFQAAQDSLTAILQNKQSDTAQRFKAYTDLGKLYHAYEIWDAAESCYRNAIALVPEDFETHYLLARDLQQAGKMEDALGFYNDALRLGPTYPATRLRMVEVLRLLNRSEEAGAQLDKILVADPGLTAAVVMRAEFALADRDYSTAIDLLHKALTAVPKADRLHYLLAQAYRGAGDEVRAREQLKLSGTIGIRVPDPLAEELEQLARGERVAVLQGRLAYNAGDFNSAVAYFRRALEEAPGSTGTRINLGASLMQVGDADGAVEQFEAVLKAQPDNATANFNLAELLLKHGKYKESMPLYERVVVAQPEDAQAQLGLARALRADKQPLKSFRHYLKVTELAPQLSTGWVELSDLLIENKRYKEAADTLGKAHAQLSTDGVIAHSYARFLAVVPDAGLRDGKLAASLAELVFKASPTLLHGETLAMAYAQNGQCSLAAQVQQQIIDEMTGKKLANADQLNGANKMLEHYKTAEPCMPPLDK